MEVIWLSDGVDLGRGSEFVYGLARATEGRTVSSSPADCRPRMRWPQPTTPQAR
jgi:hypothetical protein